MSLAVTLSILDFAQCQAVSWQPKQRFLQEDQQSGDLQIARDDSKQQSDWPVWLCLLLTIGVGALILGAARLIERCNDQKNNKSYVVKTENKQEEITSDKQESTPKVEKIEEKKTPINFLPEAEEKKDYSSEKEVEITNEINLKPASLKTNKTNSQRNTNSDNLKAQVKIKDKKVQTPGSTKGISKSPQKDVAAKNQESSQSSPQQTAWYQSGTIKKQSSKKNSPKIEVTKVDLEPIESEQLIQTQDPSQRLVASPNQISQIDQQSSAKVSQGSWYEIKNKKNQSPTKKEKDQNSGKSDLKNTQKTQDKAWFEKGKSPKKEILKKKSTITEDLQSQENIQFDNKLSNQASVDSQAKEFNQVGSGIVNLKLEQIDKQSSSPVTSQKNVTAQDNQINNELIQTTEGKNKSILHDSDGPEAPYDRQISNFSVALDIEKNQTETDTLQTLAMLNKLEKDPKNQTMPASILKQQLNTWDFEKTNLQKSQYSKDSFDDEGDETTYPKGGNHTSMSKEMENPFRSTDHNLIFNSAIQNAMAQKIGDYYTSQVKERLSANRTEPPSEIKRLPKNVVKAVKTKYSAFFDPPLPRNSALKQQANSSNKKNQFRS